MNAIWIVPDNYVTLSMESDARLMASLASEARGRGCKDYVVDYYQCCADLLREAIARLENMEEAARIECEAEIRAEENDDGGAI